MPLPLFFCTALRDSDLRKLVAGPETFAAVPARLCGRRLAEGALPETPVALADPGAAVEGLLADPGPEARSRIGFFLGGLGLRPAAVTVETREGPRPAVIWTAPGPARADAPVWKFEDWRARHGAVFLHAAREIMDHRGLSPRRASRLWPGIRIRAEARAAAEAETPRIALRSGLAAGDVEMLELRRAYADYFAVDAFRLRHRRFDGTMSPPLERSAFVSGDAVTVLPWDPVRGLVLLVEQWRAGPQARGDRVPWTLETVAGRRDASESPEETARREAREEAGLELGRLARVAAYYSSPGIAAELITSFVGEADLSAPGGLHGAADEGEDIRTHVIPLERALAAVASGEIANAPLVLTLFWLEGRQALVQAEWNRRA